MKERSKMEKHTAVLPPLLPPTSVTNTYVAGEDPSRLKDAAAYLGLLRARQPTAGVREAAALLLKAAAVEREIMHSNEMLASDESKTEEPVPPNNLMDLFAPAAAYSERTQRITKEQMNQRLLKNYERKAEEKNKVLEAKVSKLEDTIEKMTKTHAESISSLEVALNDMQAKIVELHESNRQRDLEQSRAKGITITISVDPAIAAFKRKAYTLWEAVRAFVLLPVVCSLFMAYTYPLLLFKAMRQIGTDLLKFGLRPSEIQKANRPLAGYKSYEKAAHYSSQLVFRSVFEDRAKLEAVFRDLVAEAGMEPGDGLIDWRDDEEPSVHHDEDCAKVAGDHYVGKGSNFKIDGRNYKNYKVAVALFEKRAAPGDPRETTVMQAHLPGQAWDGTSCFNFVKELVSRYYGEPNRNVFRANEIISMSSAAAAAFDDKLSVLRFIASVPVSVFKNASAIQWMRAKHVLGYPESKEGPRLFCMLNLSVEKSKKLAKALKARPDGRVAPTSALIYSAVKAYKEETGELPYCVPIQASLQTRAYEPLVKERAFVGDWLIAPLHRVRAAGKKVYTIADAQEAYKTLLDDLASCQRSVKRAFYARVFGVVKGGAATFEKAPTYADDNRLCDSVFFNNYGVRTIHEKAQCVSFNWSGAGKLNCNCILINGRICIVFASQTLPLPRLERIRDHAAETLAALADGK